MMLNKQEINQISSLLKKIDNPSRGLPQQVFDALLKIIPFVCCELVIVRNDGNDGNVGDVGNDGDVGGEILLTWREDKWWKGWHFPGGIMRYRESFEKRLAEVAKNELGVELKSYKFLFPVDYNKCSRGHGVSLVFLCEISGAPKDGKFFKKMPKNIIKEHKEIWRRVSGGI